VTIGDVSSATTATEFNVKLSKSQGDQQSVIVNKLIQSTAPSAPKGEGVGGNLNVLA
jgi:hypothetical protein